MLYVIFASVFLSYWLLSMIFLMKPGWLHKKRMTLAKLRLLRPNKVSVFAHRGGGLENFENSLSAFKHCVELKVGGIELDVHRTKDGKFVVIHDSNLERLTGQDINVEEINYDDIKPFKTTILTDFDEPYSENNDRGEKLALLEDLFKILKGSDVIATIDVKTNHKDDIDRVIEMSKRYNHLHNTIVGSINHFDPLELKSRYSENVNFFFPENQVFLMMFLFMVGLLPYIDIRYDFFLPTFYFKTVINSTMFAGQMWVHKLLWLIDFIRPVVQLMNWHLEKRGIVVGYWTLNDEEDYDLALSLGTRVIVGDRPSEIKDYLKWKGLY